MVLKVSANELASGAEQGRYHRQTLIQWWDQDRLTSARVLVAGAGALGNEVLKNLALTGIGNILVYDMDRIERSNLSRSILFRQEDEGRSKAQVAAERVLSINPELRAVGRVENLIHRAGLGVFLWADVVICAVDNREARVFINDACSRTGRQWVDGAIESLAGVVRVFDPQSGPCYECTMNETDRKLVAQRRSCALLARDIVEGGHAPATAVTASLVAALQVQEALKILHGKPSLQGMGLHISGDTNDFSLVRYPRRDDCMGHDSLGPVTALGRGSAEVTLDELLRKAESELGDGAALDFSRDVVHQLSCPDCGNSVPGKAVLGEMREKEARCPECGTHRVVATAASLTRSGDISLRCTPRELGLPLFDVIVARQGLADQRAWLLDGDASSVLGPLPWREPNQ